MILTVHLDFLYAREQAFPQDEIVRVLTRIEFAYMTVISVQVLSVLSWKT